MTNNYRFEVSGHCENCKVKLEWENTSPSSASKGLCHDCENNMLGG